jgi:hypothetical protein
MSILFNDSSSHGTERDYGKQFPAQKKSDSKKTKEWMKACIESAEDEAVYRDEKIRTTHQNKVVNYNLANDILDPADMQRICNPFKLNVSDFPAKPQNYPILNPAADTLVGEEIKRRFDWKLKAANPNAYSEGEDELNAQAKSLIEGLITNPNKSPEDIQKELQKFDKYRKFEYQDKRELMGTHVLKHLWYKEDLKTKFSAGFHDVLISSEEIYATDIIAGQPKLYRIDPLTLFTIKSGDSPYIEDSDIIVHTVYRSPGQVIDMFYDELKPHQIDAIENGLGTETASKTHILNYNTRWPTLTTDGISNSDMPLEPMDLNTIRNISGNFDEFGNIRVTRVLWKSRRKMIEVEWIDEEGELVKDLYDEHYKPQNRIGEKAKTIWINEWWEGTRIGQDIYVKMGPRPIQFRERGNLSICKPGIFGTAYNINSSTARSLYDVGKPYQYLYNTFMYRTEQAFAKDYGKIAQLDLSKIPDGWDLDTWFHYATNMGFAPIDSFKEGDKGAATGKLAGNMNTSSNVMDTSNGNYIQQNVNMLQYIEDQMSQIIGVSRQRKGQISASEGLGVAQTAITQSSHITERWFRIHDNVKLRAMTGLLETAKAAWKNDKKQLQYVTDELGTVIFDLDGEMLNETEYGMFMADANSDTQLFDSLKQLAHAGIQNDKVNFSTLMDIYHADSMAEVRRRIERAEEDKIQRDQQQQQQAQEMQTEQIQAAQQQQQLEAEAEERRNIRDNETKIQVAEINAASRTDGTDIDKDNNGIRDTIDLEKLRLQQTKMDQDFNLAQDKLTEDKRKNQKKEELEEKKLKVQRAQKQNKQ